MTATEFWTSVGDFFMWTFKQMKAAHNKPNYILWIIIWGLIFFWITRIAKQNKMAARNGTLK
jgi:hypothetical protein